MGEEEVMDKVEGVRKMSPVSAVSNRVSGDGGGGEDGRDEVGRLFEFWMREGLSGEGMGKGQLELDELNVEVGQGMGCWSGELEMPDEKGVEWGGMLEDIMDVDSKSMAFHEEEEWGGGTVGIERKGSGMERVDGVGSGRIKKSRKGEARRRKDKKGCEKRIVEKKSVDKAKDGKKSSGDSADGKDGVAMEKCVRCAKTRKDTPMMRKGPDGGRNLCNACGLKWSRHGIF